MADVICDQIHIKVYPTVGIPSPVTWQIPSELGTAGPWAGYVQSGTSTDLIATDANNVVHTYTVSFPELPYLEITTIIECPLNKYQVCINANSLQTAVTGWDLPGGQIPDSETSECTTPAFSGTTTCYYTVNVNSTSAPLPGVCTIEVITELDATILVGYVDWNCEDGFFGQLQSQVSGSTNSLTYSWGGPSLDFTAPTSEPIQTFTLTVTDDVTNCTGTDEITLDLAYLSCQGDFDNNGYINTFDLVILTGEFGDSGSGLIADLDCDELVSVTDLQMFMAIYGLDCP